MSENHLSELRFDELPLDDRIRAGIRDAGFEFCTPIQADTLPIVGACTFCHRSHTSDSDGACDSVDPCPVEVISYLKDRLAKG